MIDVLSRLQKENISHRDIKPANIIIFEGGKFKLSDFGLSAIFEQSQGDREPIS